MERRRYSAEKYPFVYAFVPNGNALRRTACVLLTLALCLRYGWTMTALSYPHAHGVDAAMQIDFLAETLGLSETEIGQLFRVTRQAVSQWRRRGIPSDRCAQVDRIVEVAQFLLRRLVPQRVPEIVRTPAKGLAGETILSTLRDKGAETIFLYIARLGAYANA